MATTRRYLAAVAAAWVLLRGLSLQAEPASHRVSVTFRVFALDPVAGLSYQPGPESPPLDVRFYSSEPSGEYQYKGPRRLVFRRAGFGLEPAATVELEPAATRVLLIFRPQGVVTGARAGAEPFQVTVMPDDPARLPNGCAGWINLSGRSLQLEQGSARWLLPEGLGPVVAVPRETRFDLSLARGGRWRPVSTLEVPGLAAARAWVVIFPAYRPTELQPQVRLLTDGGVTPEVVEGSRGDPRTP